MQKHGKVDIRSSLLQIEFKRKKNVVSRNIKSLRPLDWILSKFNTLFEEFSCHKSVYILINNVYILLNIQ
jgi:hypothetical protein